MSKPINENPNPAPRYPAPAIQIHPPNSRDATIARLTAEVERLRACMTTAGLQCFLPNGSPEQVAEHMRTVAKASNSEIEGLRANEELLRAGHRRLELDFIAKDQEVERLLASKERLAHEASVAREWNRLRNAKRGTGILSDWQKRLSKARMNCNSHNDLAPPAKGGNDGH